MAKKKYNNKDKARKFRAMRPAVGENYMYDFSQPSNSHSTHLGTTYEADGKFYVAPSITNNKAPYASSVYHPQSFREAMNAGEGIPFDTQAEASKFAEGSWKLPKYPRPSFEHGGETHDPPAYDPYAELSSVSDNTQVNNNAVFNSFFQTPEGMNWNPATQRLQENWDGTPQGGEVTPHNIIPELMFPFGKTVGLGLKGIRTYNAAKFTGTPGSMYRGIGTEGLKDLQKSRVLRPKQNISPIKVGAFDVAKDFNKIQKGVYASPSVETAKRYGQGVVAEIPEGAAKFMQRYKGTNWSQKTQDLLPVDNINVFKQNFFGKYKPVEFKHGGQVRRYTDGGLYNFSTIEPTTNIGNWAEDNGTNFAPQSPAPVSRRGGDLSKSEEHVTEMQGWYGDYINSPTYRERLERSGDYGSPEDMDEVTRLRYEALQNVTVGNDTNASHMNTKTSGMQLKPGDEEREGIIAHEVGHTVGGIYDDSTHEKPFSERSDHDKKSLSVNDIKSIEDRNTVYQNAPYISVGDENITGLNFIGGADTQYTSGDDIVTDRGTHDTNRGSVRRGTPSIEANQLSPTHYLGQEVPFATNTDVSRDPQDYDSTEEYVRANYSFPEGYEESSKEAEITRLVEAIDGNTSRDARILKAEKNYSASKKDVRNATDREDLSEDLAIQFQVENDLEYAQNYVVGSKSLKKKYRGMSLDEIPDGVDPDVDAYRKSLAVQNALHAAKKARNDERDSPIGDTRPRPYTPEGGNEAVIKRGGLHEIGASENYSDIVGMRKLLYDKYGKTPEEEVTLEEYNTLLKEYKKPTKGTNVSVPGRYSEQHTPEDAVWLLNNIAMEPTQDEGVTSAKYGGNMKKYKKGGPGSKMLPEVTVTPQMEALRNQGFDISDFPMVGFSKPEPYTGIAPDPSGMSIKQLLKLAKSFPAMMKYANKNYGSLAQIGDKVQDAYLNAKRIVDLGLSGYGKEKAALKEVDDLKDLMNQLDKAGDIIGPNRYKLMPDSKALKQGLDPDDPINLMRETLDEASFNKTLYEDALKLSKNPELKQYQIKELKKIADNSKVKLNNSNKELDNFLTGKYKSYEPLDDILLKAYTNPSAKGLQEFLPSNRNLQLNPLKQPRFQSQNKDLENLHNSFYGERITPGQSVILDQYVNPFKMNRYGGKNMKQYKKGGRPGLWDNIHAKRRRGEKMRKPGSEGAPTNAAFKNSQATYGGMLPEYGLGGFLKGALAGVVGKVPVVGGMLKEAINVDPNDKSSKIGGMIGGAGAMLFNPMGAAGAALDAVEGDEENSEIEEVAQDGGQFMPKVDYEAEDGEVIVGDVKVNRAYNGGTIKSYKGGGMHLLSGPKHSEGGIGIMQFGGDSSYVFSNSMDLKVPKEFGKFNTFADAAKSRSKSLEDIAEMRMGGESYDKRTADLMEPLAMVEFENLFNAQEDFKEQNNIGNPTRTAEFGASMSPDPNYPPLDGEDSGDGNDDGTGNNKSKLPWELYAANALPGLFNIGKGLFGTSPTMELEREEKQEYRDFTPLIDSYLDNQRRNLRFSKIGLEGSGASGSQIRMGYQNMYSGSQANTGQFFKDLNNQIEGSRLATDTSNQGVMARNQQRTLMEDQFAAENYAGNSFSKGLGQLINTGTNLYMDNLKSQNIGTQMYDMFGNFIGGKNKGR